VEGGFVLLQRLIRSPGLGRMHRERAASPAA
jgi:hypothetical protein